MLITVYIILFKKVFKLSKTELLEQEKEELEYFGLDLNLQGKNGVEEKSNGNVFRCHHII